MLYNSVSSDSVQVCGNLVFLLTSMFSLFLGPRATERQTIHHFVDNLRNLDLTVQFMNPFLLFKSYIVYNRTYILE